MNPDVSMWINAILTGLGAASTAISADQGSQAAVWASIAATVISGINTALHAKSTSQPGPLGK